MVSEKVLSLISFTLLHWSKHCSGREKLSTSFNGNIQFLHILSSASSANLDLTRMSPGYCPQSSSRPHTALPSHDQTLLCCCCPIVPDWIFRTSFIYILIFDHTWKKATFDKFFWKPISIFCGRQNPAAALPEYISSLTQPGLLQYFRSISCLCRNSSRWDTSELCKWNF